MVFFLIFEDAPVCELLGKLFTSLSTPVLTISLNTCSSSAYLNPKGQFPRNQLLNIDCVFV